MSTWHDVGRTLLGRWPSQVSMWGEEAIAAYISELRADGLDPDRAIVALRRYRPADGKDFPPSAPAVSALALDDPDRPTFDELIAGLYGPGGVFGFKRSGVTVSPWVLKFAEDKRDWLRGLPIDDPDEGKWARLRLREAWEAFCEATDGRRVAEIASRSSRGDLTRFDPLAALGVERARIGSGS